MKDGAITTEAHLIIADWLIMFPVHVPDILQLKNNKQSSRLHIITVLPIAL